MAARTRGKGNAPAASALETTAAILRHNLRSVSSMPQPQPSARSLASLLVAQAQVTFNDNAANLMLLALVQFPGVMAGTDADGNKGLLCALLVSPLVLFAPLAGWVTDRFAKSRVLKFARGGAGPPVCRACDGAGVSSAGACDRERGSACVADGRVCAGEAGHPA